MKRIILSLVKVSSFIIILISFILFIMSFSNQSYFVWLGENYLKDELKNRVELLNNKVEDKILNNGKVKGLLDKFSLDDKVNELKNKWKDIIINKTDEIVEKVFNWDIYDMKDIKLFWKSIKSEVKLIISNFILDIRIFLLTNIVWFGLIYLLMFFKTRLDIIRNMFIYVFVIFLIMLWWIFYYILWQDWVTNIVTNDFLWYFYPILILIFIILFIYFFNKNISKDDEKYITEAKSWKFYLSIKDLRESKSIKTAKWTSLFFIIIIEIILQILFIPFSI